MLYKIPLLILLLQQSDPSDLHCHDIYFNHSVHINKGIDCSKCHGNVDQMDRIVEAKELTMGFCITCHKQNNATHDCFTCHR